MDTNELRNLIDEYQPGEEKFRHPYNPRFLYTGGVQAVAEEAGAYWMLDIIATEVAPICLKSWDELGNGQHFLKVCVKGSKAYMSLVWDEGCVPLWKRFISYTDFPEGDWMFYLFMDGVCNPPNTVLVALLPSEN